MKPSISFRILIVLILVSLFAGCSRDAAPPAGGTVKKQAITVCQGGILAALPVLAHEKGFFASQGLDATLTIVGDGKATMETFLSGKCDLAVIGDPPIVKQSFKRDDFVIIASVVSSGSTSRILGRRDRGITTPASLAGKRIGVSKGTNSHFFLDQFLFLHKIPKDKVTVVDITNPQLVDALQRGDVDAFAGSDLSFLKGEQLMGDRGITFREPGLTNFSANLVVKKSWLAANRSTALKVLQSLIQAEKELEAHPAESRKLVAARMKVPEAGLATIMEQQRSTVALDQIMLLSLEDQARWMMDNGMVTATHHPNYLQFIEPTLLREISPAAVTIK